MCGWFQSHPQKEAKRVFVKIYLSLDTDITIDKTVMSLVEYLILCILGLWNVVVVDVYLLFFNYVFNKNKKKF